MTSLIALLSSIIIELSLIKNIPNLEGKIVYFIIKNNNNNRCDDNYLLKLMRRVKISRDESFEVLRRKKKK